MYSGVVSTKTLPPASVIAPELLAEPDVPVPPPLEPPEVPPVEAPELPPDVDVPEPALAPEASPVPAPLVTALPVLEPVPTALPEDVPAVLTEPDWEALPEVPAPPPSVPEALPDALPVAAFVPLPEPPLGGLLEEQETGATATATQAREAPVKHERKIPRTTASLISSSVHRLHGVFLGRAHATRGP
jgi:hypothetical protein